MSTDLGQRTVRPPITRAELANILLARVDCVASKLGDVSIAAEIQLLKRELARGHAVLAGRPEDNNFLSVVTLVEATLASMTWKAYTPGFLDELRGAFSAGAQSSEFTFEQYDTIRRHFKASGMPHGTTMEMALSAADGEDSNGAQA